MKLTQEQFSNIIKTAKDISYINLTLQDEIRELKKEITLLKEIRPERVGQGVKIKKKGDVISVDFEKR